MPSETWGSDGLFFMIEQLFVVLTEIFPFFDNGTVRQVADAVFSTIFVFLVSDLPPCLTQNSEAGLATPTLGDSCFSEAEQAAKAVATARLRIMGLIMACLSFEG